MTEPRKKAKKPGAKKKAAAKKRKTKKHAKKASVSEAPHQRVAEVTMRRMNLDDLTPAPFNPRTIDDASLRGLEASIKRFGLLEPVILNSRTGHVVGGHQRIKALRADGYTATDVLVADLPLKEEKAANVTLNNPAITGEFDDGLPDLLAELRTDLGDEDFMAIRLDGLEPAAASVSRPGALAEQFGAVPFSVLNAREGWWQERKRAWISRGIKSEEGRGDDLLNLDSAAAMVSEGMAHVGGTSVFAPVLTEILLRWFSPVGGRIIDPFAGGSVRGVVSATTGRLYVGVDLSNEQVLSNREQWREIQSIQDVDGSATWVSGDSREAIPAGPFDMLLTCPPYADLEVYSDDARDISSMDYPEFVVAYREIIAKSCAQLRGNSFAAIVVGEVRDKAGNYRGLVPDTIDAFRAAGMVYYNEAILVTAVGSLAMRTGRIFKAGRKLGKTHQNILVFVKGDAKKAASLCGHVDFVMPEEH